MSAVNFFLVMVDKVFLFRNKNECNGSVSAAFAAQSANSFPLIPTWPGIHIIFVLFCMLINACWILLTISELV